MSDMGLNLFKKILVHFSHVFGRVYLEPAMSYGACALCMVRKVGIGVAFYAFHHS